MRSFKIKLINTIRYIKINGTNLKANVKSGSGIHILKIAVLLARINMHFVVHGHSG